MDFLLSINILLYMISPSVGSWSTTLNVVFFYITWSTLVLSHSSLSLHILGVLFIRVLFFLIPSLLSISLDTSLPTLVQKIKHGGRNALPPRDARTIAKLLGLVLLNMVLMAAVEGSIGFVWLKIFKRPVFKTSTTLPLPWKTIRHVAVLMAARGGLQYYIHRSILHGDYSVAKKHKEFAHANHRPPFSLKLMADHPIPLMLHRLVPIYLPALLLRPHLLTYFLFTFICTVEETVAMCGYSFIPIMFMTGIAQRTAIHYVARGTCNFGCWGLIDWAKETSLGNEVLDNFKRDTDKRRIQDNANGAYSVKNGLDALKDRLRLKNGEPGRAPA